MGYNEATVEEDSTVLFICDMQEKFYTGIPKFKEVILNVSKVVQICNVLGIPIIVTEHIPQLFGKTVPEIDLTGVKGPFGKTLWSMCIPEVLKELETICNNKPPKSIILTGVATHACVEMTAIDLKKKGFQVHLVAECCSSSRLEDHTHAIERFKQMGCFVITIENLIGKLLKDVKHEKFKDTLRIVMTRAKL
ncbi:isochorismatase domain-containing protein 2-like [Nasonia vitripennis]|uniref:Isochorismatase domain-containing protein 1 n=1 Tax=Nasonia vitripennis TaxID=7425 RepID=A0A7M7G1R0_NASVI|nr:isochorismatase domain-containing protein 2-like [Nasonia vitripennis]